MLNLVDVRDLAEGIVRAGERGRAGERYILGGENVALRDLLPVLERLSGRRMPKRAVPRLLALATGAVSGWIADRITRHAAGRHAGGAWSWRSARRPSTAPRPKRELGYAAGARSTGP